MPRQPGDEHELIDLATGEITDRHAVEQARQERAAISPHTPGPWHVVTIAAPSKYNVVAGPILVAQIAGPYRPSLDSNEADARLIAAAPDLLHALAACYEVLTFDVPRGCASEAYGRAREMAKAALARARGK